MSENAGENLSEQGQHEYQEGVSEANANADVDHVLSLADVLDDDSEDEDDSEDDDGDSDEDGA